MRNEELQFKSLTGFVLIGIGNDGRIASAFSIIHEIRKDFYNHSQFLIPHSVIVYMATSSISRLVPTSTSWPAALTKCIRLAQPVDWSMVSVL